MKQKQLGLVKRAGCNKWYIRPTEGGTVKWIALSPNKAEAQDMARNYLNQRMLKKVHGFNSKADIHIAIERYLKDKFATTLTTKKSKQRYEGVIRRFQEFARRHFVENISDVKTEIIREYLVLRAEEIKDKTWNVERMVISNFFKYCIDNDWAIKNPVSKIPSKQLTLPHVEHLDEDEVGVLLEQIKAKNYKVPYYELITTLLYTGMRVNEAVHLTKRDVDMGRWLIAIQEKVINGNLWRPKTKDKRYVPIPDELKSIIRQQMRSEGELLFQNSNGNLLMDRRILERVKSCCKKAGLKEVHVHSLRHTFTSIASMKGIDPLLIQDVLGHKSDSMTRRYRHMSPDFLQKQFEGFKYGEKEEKIDQ